MRIYILCDGVVKSPISCVET